MYTNTFGRSGAWEGCRVCLWEPHSGIVGSCKKKREILFGGKLIISKNKGNDEELLLWNTFLLWIDK